MEYSNGNILDVKKRIVIEGFRGEYSFLSNMYPCHIELGPYTFTCAEAAFQAYKCPSRADEFVNLSGKDAKSLGRKVKLITNWEHIKLKAMYRVVNNKFEQNSNLKEKLLNTGNALIIEKNYWNDTYWGVNQQNLGENNLGKILMRVRDELKK